ncbi:uncharacterized protein LOC144451388 isoform X2 [Glandiceps talaboti]
MAEVRPVSRRQASRRHSYGPSPVVAGEIDSTQLDAMNLRYGSESVSRPPSRPGTSRSIGLPPGRTPPVSPENSYNSRPKTRPKSAKGRSRPGTSGYRSQKQSHHDDSDPDSAIEKILNNAPPSRPSSSLSRYTPLPSIRKNTTTRGSEQVNLSQELAYMNIHDDVYMDIHENEMDSESEMIGIDDNHVPSFEKGLTQNYYEGPDGELNFALNSHGDTETQPMRNLGKQDSVQNLNQNLQSPPAVEPPQAIPSPTKKVSRRHFRHKQKERLDRAKLSVAIPDEPSEKDDRLLLAIRLPEGERLQRFFRPSNTLKEILAYADSRSEETLLECEMFVNDVPRKVFTNLNQTIEESNLAHQTVIYLEEKDE